MQFNCKKTARKTELNVLWHNTGFPSGLLVFCQFCVSSCVCETMVDKKKAVVCCLLATLAVILSEKKKIKRKMWNKKWYLKRSVSCDAHLLNELLEMDVSWDDAIVVLASKLRKLWDSWSELRSSLCERRLERTVLRPALLLVKTAQFTQFFLSDMMSHSKIAQFNWECTGHFMYVTYTPPVQHHSWAGAKGLFTYSVSHSYSILFWQLFAAVM